MQLLRMLSAGHPKQEREGLTANQVDREEATVIALLFSFIVSLCYFSWYSLNDWLGSLCC